MLIHTVSSLLKTHRVARRFKIQDRVIIIIFRYKYIIYIFTYTYTDTICIHIFGEHTYSLRACAFAMLLPFLRTSKLQMDSTQIRPSFVALGGKQQPQEPLEKQKVDSNKSITIRSNISQMLGALNVSLNITLLPQERKVPRFTEVILQPWKVVHVSRCILEIYFWMCGMYVFARYPSYHIRQEFALKKINCAVTVALWLHLQLVNFESDTYTWGFFPKWLLSIVSLTRCRSCVARPLRKWMVLGRSLIKFMWLYMAGLVNCWGSIQIIQGHFCLNCTQMYLRIFSDVVRFIWAC